MLRSNSLRDYTAEDSADSFGLKCLDVTRTVQNTGAQTDINEIVKRFGITGQLPVPSRLPTYGDFDQISDYQTALHAVMSAENAFMALPAEVRTRFKNDPQLFVEFASDERNNDELVKMGLRNKPDAVIVPPEPAVPPVN